NAATALAPRVIVAVSKAGCIIDDPFVRRGWRRRLPRRRLALELATSSQRTVPRSNRLKPFFFFRPGGPEPACPRDTAQRGLFRWFIHFSAIVFPNRQASTLTIWCTMSYCAYRG